RRQSRFGIDTEKRQEDGPRWENDRQEPEVYSNGHDSMPFQFEQRPESVRQKKTRRRQKQIPYPQIDGKYPFSLINHASPQLMRILELERPHYWPSLLF